MKTKIFAYLLTLAFFLTSLSPIFAAGTKGELGDILKSPQISQEKYIIGNTLETGLLDTFFNGYTCSLMSCQDSSGNTVKQGMVPGVSSTIAYLFEHHQHSLVCPAVCRTPETAYSCRCGSKYAA